MSETTKLPEEIVYRSPHKGNSERRYTVVALQQKGNVYSVGLSIAGSNDTFNKKMGIVIARGRAISRPVDGAVHFNEKNVSVHTQFTRFAKSLPDSVPKLFSPEYRTPEDTFSNLMGRKRIPDETLKSLISRFDAEIHENMHKYLKSLGATKRQRKLFAPKKS